MQSGAEVFWVIIGCRAAVTLVGVSFRSLTARFHCPHSLISLLALLVWICRRLFSITVLSKAHVSGCGDGDTHTECEPTPRLGNSASSLGGGARKFERCDASVGKIDGF